MDGRARPVRPVEGEAAPTGCPSEPLWPVLRSTTVHDGPHLDAGAVGQLQEGDLVPVLEVRFVGAHRRVRISCEPMWVSSETSDGGRVIEAPLPALPLACTVQRACRRHPKAVVLTLVLLYCVYCLSCAGTCGENGVCAGFICACDEGYVDEGCTWRPPAAFQLSGCEDPAHCGVFKITDAACSSDSDDNVCSTFDPTTCGGVPVFANEVGNVLYRGRGRLEADVSGGFSVRRKTYWWVGAPERLSDCVAELNTPHFLRSGGSFVPSAPSSPDYGGWTEDVTSYKDVPPGFAVLAVI
jgi:hypothetical protein